MNRRPTLRALAAVGLVAALTVAASACSSDAKTSSATTAPKTTTTTAASSTTMAASNTIVDVAAGNKDFSTLVAAVKAADLVKTLSGTGPYTVFAPTNAAFAKLPAGTVDTLLKPENKAKLAAILTYHVVAGKVMAADLTNGQKVKTVEGDTLTVTIAGSKVTLTDTSGNTVNIVKTDIPADNGVIHVIDGVLIPKG